MECLNTSFLLAYNVICTIQCVKRNPRPQPLSAIFETLVLSGGTQRHAFCRSRIFYLKIKNYNALPSFNVTSLWRSEILINNFVRKLKVHLPLQSYRVPSEQLNVSLQPLPSYCFGYFINSGEWKVVSLFTQVIFHYSDGCGFDSSSGECIIFI